MKDHVLRSTEFMYIFVRKKLLKREGIENIYIYIYIYIYYDLNLDFFQCRKTVSKIEF